MNSKVGICFLRSSEGTNTKFEIIPLTRNMHACADAHGDISRDLSRLSASTITFNSQYGPGHQHATNVANQAIARVDSAPSSIRTMCTLQQEQYASSMAGSQYYGYHGGHLRSRRSPSSTGVRVPVLQAPSHVSQYTARRLRRYTAVAKALEKVRVHNTLSFLVVRMYTLHDSVQRCVASSTECLKDSICSQKR